MSQGSTFGRGSKRHFPVCPQKTIHARRAVGKKVRLGPVLGLRPGAVAREATCAHAAFPGPRAVGTWTAGLGETATASWTVLSLPRAGATRGGGGLICTAGGRRPSQRGEARPVEEEWTTPFTERKGRVCRATGDALAGPAPGAARRRWGPHPGGRWPVAARGSRRELRGAAPRTRVTSQGADSLRLREGGAPRPGKCEARARAVPCTSVP